MADYTYTNPEAVRPAYDWKPTGFLAGMNYDQDRTRYENMASLQDAMMMNQANESDDKRRDYALDAPVREAERAQKINKSNVDVETYGPLQRGAVKQRDLEVALKEGTFQSDIARAVAEAAIKGGEASTKQFEQFTAQANALSEAAGSGPASKAAVLNHMRANKASPQMIQFFENIDPKHFKATVKAMNKGIAEANVQYQSHMEGIKENNKSQERIAGIQAASQMAVAKERAKQKERSIDQILNDVGKVPVERQPGLMDMILSDSDATLEQKTKALKIRENAIKALNQRAKEGSPEIPGLPAGKPRNFDDQGNPTSRAIPFDSLK